MTSLLSRTSVLIRSTATTLRRTFPGLTKAIPRSSLRSSTPSTQAVRALTPQTVSSIRILQSKVSRSRGVVLPGERPWLSLSFDEFTSQFDRIKDRVDRGGGSAAKRLVAYLSACDPDRCRANYLLEANYTLLEKYFDGGIFDA